MNKSFYNDVTIETMLGNKLSFRTALNIETDSVFVAGVKKATHRLSGPKRFK